MYEQDVWTKALRELANTINGQKRDYSNHPYFLSTCEASDSGQPVKMCWCAECREIRNEYGVRKARETKEYAY